MDQEQENARYKSELDDLRGNMSYIMEMIQALSTKIDHPHVTIISEIYEATFDP